MTFLTVFFTDGMGSAGLPPCSRFGASISRGMGPSQSHKKRTPGESPVGSCDARAVSSSYTVYVKGRLFTVNVNSVSPRTTNSSLTMQWCSLFSILGSDDKSSNERKNGMGGCSSRSHMAVASVFDSRRNPQAPNDDAYQECFFADCRSRSSVLVRNETVRDGAFQAMQPLQRYGDAGHRNFGSRFSPMTGRASPCRFLSWQGCPHA